MEWTTTKPKLVGFYYHRGVKSDEAQVVQVVQQGSQLACRYPGDSLEYTIPSDEDRGYHGEWSNQPIDPPREAREETTHGSN